MTKELQPPRLIGVLNIARASPFLAAGVLDGALTAFGEAGAAGAASIPAAACLWFVVGLILSLLGSVAARIVLGRDNANNLQSTLIEHLGAWRSDKGTDVGAARFANLTGGVAAFAAFFGLSFVTLLYLVTNKNSAILITATFLFTQLPIIIASLAVGHTVKRAAARLFAKTRWSTLAGVAALIGAGLLGALVGVIVLWETFLAVDGVALVLFAAASLGAALIRWRPAPRRFGWGAPVVGLLLAGVLLFITAQSSTIYRATGETYGAKYALSAVQSLSDFDGDGAPSFPRAIDCAPFDGTINASAAEIPSNGIDENCDGLDHINGAYTPKRPVATNIGPLERPNFILITIDTVRADHLGYMGYTRPTTPNLDALAATSTVFTHGFSQDSGTGPSLWSLMAGKTPFETALVEPHFFPPQLAPTETTLAERLKTAGYDTAVVLCGQVFGPKKKPRKVWNIRRGFTHAEEVCSHLGGKAAYLAPHTTRAALKRLDALTASKKPFFLWVHFYDPHGPYQDHADINFGDRPIDHYDEELAYTDREMKPFLDAALALDPQPIIALTADHGENFNEHGRAPHARNLYRNVTNVPLLYYVPGQPGRRIDAPATVGDIHPTFLEFAGIPRPKDVTMVSQAATLLGAPPDLDRLVFQENSFSRPKHHVKAVLSYDHHLIWDTTTDSFELYAIREDPNEKKNLAGKGHPAETRLAPILKTFAAGTFVPPSLAK